MLAKLKDPKVGGAVAALVLLVAVVNAVLFMTGKEEMPGNAPVTQAWFYDESSKKLIEAPVRDAAKQDAPQAIVFACGSCAEEGNRFIGFLKRKTPKGWEVKLPDEGEWVAYMDLDGVMLDEGLAVIGVDKRKDCGGKKLTRCRIGRF